MIWTRPLFVSRSSGLETRTAGPSAGKRKGGRGTAALNRVVSGLGPSSPDLPAGFRLRVRQREGDLVPDLFRTRHCKPTAGVDAAADAVPRVEGLARALVAA